MFTIKQPSKIIFGKNTAHEFQFPKKSLVITSSYPFSNEGIPHGHALAFTTTAAHNFNKSQFYERFQNLVKKLDFPPIHLKQNLDQATDIIMTDRKHLDNNPKKITKKNVFHLLESINQNKTNNFS